jgi:hypothetical protein
LEYEGFGGLPVGLHGKAIVLHSGGAPSYFASVDTMKAGMELTLLYFYTHETPPQHMRRAIATAALLREHHPSRDMKLMAMPFDSVSGAILQGIPKRMISSAIHRAMASSASRVAEAQGARWVSSGLTSDGVENVSAYSAEVAAKGITVMFPEASKTTEELWGQVMDSRLKAKMPRLPWKLLSAEPETKTKEELPSREWVEGKFSDLVRREVARSFDVDLGRGFADYFASMDSFATQLKAARRL